MSRLLEAFGLTEGPAGLVIHAFKNGTTLLTIESRDLEGAYEWIQQHGLDGVAEYVGSFSTLSMQTHQGSNSGRAKA
jgi:hypothetical protein